VGGISLSNGVCQRQGGEATKLIPYLDGWLIIPDGLQLCW
jgi:hypothetical protein